MAEVIGLLGGRYSEADKIVEVSVCLYIFSTVLEMLWSSILIRIDGKVISEGQVLKYIEVN